MAVYDSAGNFLGPISFTSDSGTIYPFAPSAPALVPEPATALLLMAPVAAALFFRRRRLRCLRSIREAAGWRVAAAPEMLYSSDSAQ